MASPMICNAIRACQDFIECRSSFNNLKELRISTLDKNKVLYININFFMETRSNEYQPKQFLKI